MAAGWRTQEQAESLLSAAAAAAAAVDAAADVAAAARTHGTSQHTADWKSSQVVQSHNAGHVKLYTRSETHARAAKQAIPSWDAST